MDPHHASQVQHNIMHTSTYAHMCTHLPCVHLPSCCFSSSCSKPLSSCFITFCLVSVVSLYSCSYTTSVVNIVMFLSHEYTNVYEYLCMRLIHYGIAQPEMGCWISYQSTHVCTSLITPDMGFPLIHLHRVASWQGCWPGSPDLWVPAQCLLMSYQKPVNSFPFSLTLC